MAKTGDAAALCPRLLWSLLFGLDDLCKNSKMQRLDRRCSALVGRGGLSVVSAPAEGWSSLTALFTSRAVISSGPAFAAARFQAAKASLGLRPASGRSRFSYWGFCSELLAPKFGSHWLPNAARTDWEMSHAFSASRKA